MKEVLELLEKMRLERENTEYKQPLIKAIELTMLKLIKMEVEKLDSNRFEQQVSLGASQPVLLAEDSKEYKLWCEIVTDVTTYAGTDEGINIIEKIENLFGLDNTDNFNELEKKAVTHLNSLKNTWE